MAWDMAITDMMMTMTTTCIAIGPGGLDTSAFYPRNTYAGLAIAGTFTLAVIGTVMGLRSDPTIMLTRDTTIISTNL
jgi:hypothetical protein